MSRKTINNQFHSPPFEKKVPSSNNPLCLKKSSVVNLIKNAINEPTFDSLCQRVIDIQDTLNNSQLEHLVTNDNCVIVSYEYVARELERILNAHTLERARYYLDRLLKAVCETKQNRINDINLYRWKEYTDIITDSLWILNRRDNTGVHTSGYWGNFIPQIPNQIIRRYTKQGQWILDTFAGCGTTLIESQRLGRNSIGIELQSEIVEKANKLIKSEPNQHETINEVVQGDSLDVGYDQLLSRYGIKKVQLLIMHPPYFDIIKFSNDPKDFSNLSSVNEFTEKMGKVIDRTSHYLERGCFLVIVIGDKYAKGEWIPLGFHVMQKVLEKGFSLKSIIVKNFEETAGKRNQKELWRYRALAGGFYVFKHEYILIFRRK